MCEQPQLFTEMRYLASRQNWNLQTWKYQTQTLELCHLARSKFRIRDLRCTIHRNKPGLQYINRIQIHGKSNDSLSRPVQNEMSLFVPVKQVRKQSHAIFKSFKCSSATQVENLRHSKGSVSQFLINCLDKFMCEQLQLFAELKYLASRQFWNLQTLKVPDTKS